MKDPIEIMEEFPGNAVAYRIDGVFIVDDIPYNWLWAEHNIRPMIQLIDDDSHAVPSRWNPTPLTEAELAMFVKEGMIDGAYLP